MNKKQPKRVDGKVVRTFLFARQSRLSNHPELISVEGFSLDHCFNRLVEWSKFPRKEWEVISELDPEHFIGALGRHLPLSLLQSPPSRFMH